MELDIATPRWAVPLLEPARYKCARGGRGSGKSHFFAELMIEEHVLNPNQKSVCIREIQKSLQFSARELLKGKISALGVSHLFDITLNEIKSINGTGTIIFQGMQDHTADSIKSLEGFDRAWVEEAQSMSHRSIQLLRPTIRNPGSQIWFSWNPDQPTDAIDELFSGEMGLPDNAILIHVNYDDNPFLPDTLRDEMEFDRKYNPDSFGHVWLGEYNKRSDAQIFAGKWRVDEFTPGAGWDGPYHGLDFGFSTDPTAGVRVWIHDQRIWIEYEAGRVGLELDDTANYLDQRIPGFCSGVVRADSARPESISYLKRLDLTGERKHIPRIEPVKKWPGSVEDGIEFIKSFKEVVIHVRCKEMQKEARLYSYRIDKRTGDILTDIEDAHNHYWDACIEKDQLITTLRGDVPVQDVVVGDYVLTRRGWKSVLASGKIKDNAKIFEMVTERGMVLRTTEDHRVFLAGKGFARMDSIGYNDSVLSLGISSCVNRNASNMGDFCGTDIQTRQTVQIEITSKDRRLADAFTFIGRSGRTILAQSLTDIMSITRMKTQKTMIHRILTASLQKATDSTMAHGEVESNNTRPISKESDRYQKPGMLHLKEGQSTKKLAHWLTKISLEVKKNVSNVARLSRQGTLETLMSFAQTSASPHIEEHLALTTSNECAGNVQSHSLSTNMQKHPIAVDRVLCVRDTGTKNAVYDLMVDDAEEFFASGVLVHNCRYALGGMITGRGSMKINPDLLKRR